MLNKLNLTFVILCNFVIGCSVIPYNAKLRNPSSDENPACAISCSTNQVCMNTFSDKGAECVAVPNKPELIFTLPFDLNTEVVCTHSSGSGSHSGANAFYALDLATDYKMPASIIRASEDGVAYVFLGEDPIRFTSPEKVPNESVSITQKHTYRRTYVFGLSGSWGRYE